MKPSSPMMYEVPANKTVSSWVVDSRKEWPTQLPLPTEFAILTRFSLTINSSSGFSENNACCEKKHSRSQGAASCQRAKGQSGTRCKQFGATLNQEQSNTVQPADTRILATLNIHTITSMISIESRVCNHCFVILGLNITPHSEQLSIETNMARTLPRGSCSACWDHLGADPTQQLSSVPNHNTIIPGWWYTYPSKKNI